MYGMGMLSSDLMGRLSLDGLEAGANESSTEASCDLLADSDMVQLSLELEKEK